METLEMLSKLHGESTIARSKNMGNVDLVSECVRKDCRQTLAQIAEIHTSRRCRKRRLQFWQSNNWDLLHDNALAHRSQLVQSVEKIVEHRDPFKK
ncbi:hypothetical protein TNCV_3979241 [Trichonephila clavipes]|nr:hypothetical protein TNCV_3979241 [Trichonephila clavipes]